MSGKQRKGKDTIKVSYTLTVVRCGNLPTRTKGYDVTVVWKRGSKKSNQGSTPLKRQKAKDLAINETCEFISTMHMDKSTSKFSEKHIQFVVRAYKRGGGSAALMSKKLGESPKPKSKPVAIGRTVLNLGQHCKNEEEERLGLRLARGDKSPTLSIVLTCKWLKVNGKPVKGNSKNKQAESGSVHTFGDQDVILATEAVQTERDEATSCYDDSVSDGDKTEDDIDGTGGSDPKSTSSKKPANEVDTDDKFDWSDSDSDLDIEEEEKKSESSSLASSLTLGTSSPGVRRRGLSMSGGSNLGLRRSTSIPTSMNKRVSRTPTLARAKSRGSSNELNNPVRKQVTVVVKAARDLPGVGPKGTSNPFCVVRIADKHYKTPTVSGTTNPIFNSKFKYDVYEQDRLPQSVRVEVWHGRKKYAKAAHRFMGAVVLDVDRCIAMARKSRTLTAGWYNWYMLDSSLIRERDRQRMVQAYGESFMKDAPRRAGEIQVSVNVGAPASTRPTGARRISREQKEAQKKEQEEEKTIDEKISDINARLKKIQGISASLDLFSDANSSREKTAAEIQMESEMVPQALEDVMMVFQQLEEVRMLLVGKAAKEEDGRRARFETDASVKLKLVDAKVTESVQLMTTLKHYMAQGVLG